MEEVKLPPVRMRVNGREMMRIQGVYMYIINRNGQLGALLGFHPLVIVIYEDAEDHEAVKGYLRVDRWMYPLTRSFAPIYAWGPDKLVMPEPFSTVTDPVYIIIRLPLAMSRHQKDTLWNLLDVYAHLKGKFSHLTAEEIKRMDKRFLLTEITALDKLSLDRAEKGPSQPGTEYLPRLDTPRMAHKLQALTKQQARLSISFSTKKERKELPATIATKSTTNLYLKETTMTRSKDQEGRRSSSRERRASSIESGIGRPGFESKDSNPSWPGAFPKLVALPPERGNLIRLYILGPRDPQHIKITTVMEWLPVTQIILSAVNMVFREQVRLRREKEEIGVPPSFEGRKLRLIGGWGGAEWLNEFGVSRKMLATANGPHIDPKRPDPSLNRIFCSAMCLQNLEAAANLYDHYVDNCKLELLGYSADDADPARSSPTKWLGPLVPRDLTVRYRRLESVFGKLMTLSATVASDIAYQKYGSYLERLHEDCEHHYPKLRPRNPMLDPKFEYPRLPPPYQTAV